MGIVQQLGQTLHYYVIDSLNIFCFMICCFYLHVLLEPYKNGNTMYDFFRHSTNKFTKWLNQDFRIENLYASRQMHFSY